MTLEQVMALDGTALNEAVALRLGWQCFELNNLPAWKRPDGTITNPFHIPDFANDWSAAMRIRDWARGLPRSLCQEFIYRLIQCVEERVKKVGWTANAYDVLLLAECPDYARAALLVGE